MYESILLVHSWVRWMVVLAIVYFFLRSLFGWLTEAAWTEKDDSFIWVFNQLFGIQIAFGFTLWIALSPFTKAFMKDPSLIFDNSLMSFWALRHGLTMIFAMGAFHIGRGRSKRSPPEKRFKIFTFAFGVVIVMIASAIPWPWLSYGRPLFRWML